jgi:putative ABC transport system substrate-binding protein
VADGGAGAAAGAGAAHRRALSGLAANHPDTQALKAAFLQGLQQLGWTDGRNVQIEYRWGEGNADTIRKYATELAALAPDVILVTGTGVGPLLQATRTVPIVFTIVPDPVGSGFVASLARPGGNATGFMLFEYATSGKWPELLKQIAPSVTRAAVLWDPTIPSGIGQFAVIQSVAPSVGMEVSPVNMRDAAETERAVAAFAREPNGGLIVTASALSVAHRDLIVTLAARHKLPAVYYRLQTKDLWRSGISPKARRPASERTCSAWAKCLGKAGRLQSSPTNKKLVQGWQMSRAPMSAIGTKRT